jgi:hypothetical protein
MLACAVDDGPDRTDAIRVSSAWTDGDVAYALVDFAGERRLVAEVTRHGRHGLVVADEVGTPLAIAEEVRGELRALDPAAAVRGELVATDDVDPVDAELLARVSDEGGVEAFRDLPLAGPQDPPKAPRHCIECIIDIIFDPGPPYYPFCSECSLW